MGRLREIVRDRLNEVREEARQRSDAAALLARLPSISWADELAVTESLRTTGGLHAVLDAVTEELYRDAGVGLGVIEAVLALHPGDRVIHGRALRLQAHALHQEGEGLRARTALADAVQVLADTDTPAGTYELLHTRLFRAYLDGEAGHGDVALPAVRAVAREFALRGDAKGTLHARLMEAAILFNNDDFATATQVNQDALSIAESLHDERRRAIALGNLGHCAQQLSVRAENRGIAHEARTHADRALAYFAQAMPLYASLRMDAESQRFVWAIAGIARQRGDVSQAYAQLRHVRDEFLHRSMFLAAALVALDLIELLVMLDRYDLVGTWHNEVAVTFARAGMPQYAMASFERVRDAAAEQKVDAPLLALVRSELRERFEAA